MVVDVGLATKETGLHVSRMAPVKESFATRMPNASDRFLKDADSANVKMVGRETGEHALI